MKDEFFIKVVSWRVGKNEIFLVCCDNDLVNKSTAVRQTIVNKFVFDVATFAQEAFENLFSRIIAIQKEAFDENNFASEGTTSGGPILEWGIYAHSCLQYMVYG